LIEAERTGMHSFSPLHVRSRREKGRARRQDGARKRRRLFHRHLLWALLLPFAACGPPGDPAPPHIILISTDALRADHLSLYGYPRQTSPSISDLARTSFTFSNAITVIAKTGPSFATMLSGRHPQEHRVQKNRQALPADLPYLPEILKEHGYRTAAFLSNYNLSHEKGYSRGFDMFRMFPLDKRKVEAINEAFAQWARADWDQPTFIWIHYIDPHGPYTPPPDYSGMFVDDELFDGSKRVTSDYDTTDVAEQEDLLRAVPIYQRLQGEDRVAYYVAQYDAEIRYVDNAVGEIISLLRKRGLFDESVFIFTSDHGESMGEHDYYFEHGAFAYQATLHIPLIIKRPGQREGRTVDTLVSTLDVVPTLLNLAGIAPDLELKGRDLSGGAEKGASPVLIENAAEYPRKLVGLSTARYKYLKDESTGEEELYDLSNDPQETTNLSEGAPELLDRFRLRLSKTLAETRERARWEQPVVPPLDEAIAARLRALGYVQ